MNFPTVSGGICAAKGFKAGGLHCGIRKNASKDDLALILCETQCSAAAVFTQNKVKGAPLLVTKQHIADGKAQAVLCNSGNANTCNPDGMDIAHVCCQLAAKATGLQESDIAIASTGVIGQPMPLAPFESGIPALAKAITADAEGSSKAAGAIMTTDTIKKEVAVSFPLSGHTCHLGAIAKGSGMININMATMLQFLTTDAAISPAMLQKALSAETVVSLNQVYVDGDTSTNDTALILASGLAGNPEITSENEDYATFCAALHQVCVAISRLLAADGEGATKLLECTVEGAPNDKIARAVAKSVIASDLFKAAMFGADANWGRVLCAIGYTEGEFSAGDVSLTLESAAGAVHVCEHSAYHPFREEEAAKVLAEKEIGVHIHLHDGEASAQAWGCDLTYDYVKINGDYRT